jgi:hypothetical protein
MKYEFKNTDGRSQSFRATSFLDVLDFVNDIEAHEDFGWSFFIDGVECSMKDIVLHASIKDANRIAKRNETKKPVRISVGATCLPNTYRTVWVKK